MISSDKNSTSQLSKVNSNILGLKPTINGKYYSINYLNGNNYNSKFKYLHSLRGNNSKQLTERVKIIPIRESEAKISSNNKEYLSKYVQYILTTDTPDVTNNSPNEENEHIDRYKCVLCNMDYKTF